MDLTLVLAFFLFLFIAMKIAKSSANPSPNLPPGPWKLPIIGSMHHFLWGSPLPHRRFQEMAAKHGPLVHLQLGQIPVVVASSAAVAKEIMKTHDAILASRPEIRLAKAFTYGRTEIFFAPYGDYWRSLKKISMLGLLTNKRVKSYQSIREEEVCNLVKCVSSSVGSPINLSEMIMDMLTDISSRAVFGERCSSRNQFKLALKEVSNLLWENNVADFFPSLEFITVAAGTIRKFTKVHQNLDNIMDEIFQEYKSRRKLQDDGEEESLVDTLLRLQEQGGLEFPLTYGNIKAVITEMFAGGMETTGTTIVWVMSELMRNPDAMAKAQADVRRVVEEKGKIDESVIGDMRYLKLVVKESLRLHPPVPLLPRESMETCKIDGYEIPNKTRLLVNVWAIGRDPQHWTDPELFLPERFNEGSFDFAGTDFKFTPFGAGRRVCPGTSFGLANAELALAQLLYYFNWEIPYGVKPEELDMTEELGISIHRKAPLHLVPTSSIR